MKIWIPDDLMPHERDAATGALTARQHQPAFGAPPADAAGMLTGGPALTSPLLAQLPRLVAVVRFARGRHDLSGEAAICRAAGLGYAAVGGSSAASTAEHTIMLMLALLRRLPQATDGMRRRQWTQRPLAEKGIRDLCDATVGLIGMGAVGREVTRLLRAFGARILYFKPSRLSASEEARLGVAYAEIDALLQEADVISLHARRSGPNTPVLDAARLERVRAGGIVVNTGDGRDIDLPALLRRVRAGQLSAGLDVFPAEPCDGFDPEELRAEGLLLTPHIAGRSIGAARSLFERAAAALDDLLRESAA
jgi:phosphoglycerate dehydrogenase-like enzyme